MLLYKEDIVRVQKSKTSWSFMCYWFTTCVYEGAISENIERNRHVRLKSLQRTLAQMSSIIGPDGGTDGDSSFLTNPLDHEEFRRQGHMMIDFLANYYQNIATYPVSSQVQPGYLRNALPASAPYAPEPIETILQDVQKYIIPGLTHWQSPNCYAHFPSSGSIAGILGEMLSTGFNVVGFSWISSPAATELENIVMDWLGEVLKLPGDFLFSGNGGGVILGTTFEAILCTLVAARDQMLEHVGRENIGKLAVYGSDQTQCALEKAAHVAGINPNNYRAIKRTNSTSYGLSPESFQTVVELDMKNGLIPLFLCATIGTTSSAAIDPIELLCDVAKQYNIWVHVDAAYAGSAWIVSEFRHYLDGIENANSISFNAHEWFLTNLDCCCLWVKDSRALVKSLSTNPEYLKNEATDSKKVVDYKDWQIPLSRRFRALKLWLVFQSYGVTNLRNFLRHHVKLAELFEHHVRLDKRFEIVAPRHFAMVTFRLSPEAIAKKVDGEIQLIAEDHVNKVNDKLLSSINASGVVYMTHCMVERMYVIRCAIGATLTQEEHVILCWRVVQQHADVLLGV